MFCLDNLQWFGFLGINELPMSVMIICKAKESGANLAIQFTVRKHGPASTGLFNVKVNIKVGGQIGIRGPYGNCTVLISNTEIEILLLVGGGTGLVPMMRLLTFVKPTDDVTNF